MDLRDDDDIEDRRGGVKIHDESNRVCTCACYRAAKPVENRDICYLCIYVYHRSQGNELHLIQQFLLAWIYFQSPSICVQYSWILYQQHTLTDNSITFRSIHVI